jgi:hypothetical protein
MVEAAAVRGRQRAVILLEGSRERQKEGLQGEQERRWDRLAWELGDSPRSRPPGRPSASRVGVRRRLQEMWDTSPHVGR